MDKTIEKMDTCFQLLLINHVFNFCCDKTVWLFLASIKIFY